MKKAIKGPMQKFFHAESTVRIAQNRSTSSNLREHEFTLFVSMHFRESLTSQMTANLEN
jgi:hypothetical protein